MHLDYRPLGLKAAVLGVLFAGIGLMAYSINHGNPSGGSASISHRVNGSNPEIVKQDLGRLLFFDTTLSNPVGQSCASCHAEEAGFTFPDSRINSELGVATGAVKGRFGNRAVPTIAYAAYLLQGPPQYDNDLQTYVGGMFWDGRATDLADQATFPFQNPNEMNNLVHNLPDIALVVKEVSRSPEARLFQEVYGRGIFSQPAQTGFSDVADAIAAFEKTPEVSPFSSKYDAYLKGRAQLTSEELDGLRLITGSYSGRPGGPPYRKFAQCAQCHAIPSDRRDGPDLFTNTCYANDGVPRNPNNPYYTMTNQQADPAGFNPDGYNYVDIGLGDYLYPQMGLPPGNEGPGNNGQGDFLAINGTFKAPTLRNADKRPYREFVKAYFHNGSFKDLKQVVHFYNTRNLTTVPGEVIDFTQPDPYANLQGTPLWPEPEYPSPITLQNPNGAPASASAQVGNLGLTDQEEDHIVAFIKTLTDGYDDGHGGFDDHQ
jgi:cytochrome c peroxidase